MKTQRAERNRTLTITDLDRVRLKDRIIEYTNISADTDFLDKTIHGDLLQVIKNIPDQFADLIIIDPPYNLSKNFNGLKFSASDDQTYETYLESWFSDVHRKLKPNGSMYVCGDWKSTASLHRVISRYLTIINRITWQREKGRGALNNWKNGMEDIWFAVNDPKDYFFDVESVKMKRKVIAPYKTDDKQPKDWIASHEGNFRITYPSNFWDDISIPFWSMPENTDHPTQKPEKLYAKLILASSRPNAVIFDPFLGSGTASVVAKKLGRHYCGIEINEEYCYFAEKRLETADNNHEIQGYVNKVFWERNTLPVQRVLEKKSRNKGYASKH